MHEEDKNNAHEQEDISLEQFNGHQTFEACSYDN
jgi:hypothetical protein